MEVLAGATVRISFSNDHIQEITGVVIQVFEDSLRIETGERHFFILKNAIAKIEIID